MLCNVKRYCTKNYIENVPHPTDPAVRGATAGDAPSDGERDEQQPLDLLLAHKANLLATAEDSDSEAAAAQDAAVVLPQIAGLTLHDEKPRDAVAADQQLVNNFFIEGSSAVGGKTFSRYPIYGKRSAEARLAAVRAAIYDAHKATKQLPRHTGSALHSGHGFESREQYWRRLARATITQAVERGLADHDKHAQEHALDSFYLVDLGRVVEQMARWRHCLPMVRPYYAVKCNPQLALLEVLAALGAGFDCASRAEIELVLDHQLVDSPDDIIFANPCKQLGDLCCAERRGVTYTTFDNLMELEKIAKNMPHARALLRIRTNDSAAVCAFSTKFGAPLAEVHALLRRARELNVDIYGVSFHVGSGNCDASAYVGALHDARWTFEQASLHGFNCTVLDIGGGYPGVPPMSSFDVAADGSSGPSVLFEEVAAAMRPVLEELFHDTTIISEPGRFFTAASHALVMNVFASRTLPLSKEEKQLACAAYEGVLDLEDATEHQFYVNDGLYQSFNCILFDHAHPLLLLLDDGDGAERPAQPPTASSAVLESPPPAMGTSPMQVTTTSSPGGALSPLGDVCQPDVTSSDVHERRKTQERRPLRLTTIFGPTCDSLDCILRKQPFPQLRLGDWLLAPDTGSYTTSAGCAFNGFATRRFEIICSVNL